MKFMLNFSVLIISFISLFLQAQVTHVTSLSQLNSLINTHKNVIIKFYADYCPPCKKFAPIYAEVSHSPSFTDILFIEVNTDKSRDIALAYGVQSIPKMTFVKNQQVIGTESGFKSADQLKNIIGRYFSL